MVTDVVIPTPDRIEEDVEHLKEWISKEPHLPKIDDCNWLKTFLYQNKFKTKSKLEGYYSMRSKYPELLNSRNPISPEILKSRQFVKMAVSEQLMKDKNTWFLFIRFEGDASGYDAVVYAKKIYMIKDMMLFKHKNQTTNLIIVLDFENFTYVHCLKYMTVAAKFFEILNKAYAERTKATHMINFPTFAQKFLELTQKFNPKKTNDRMIVHSATKSTLLNMVDKKVLCKDFGGDGPSLAELEERTHQELEKHRKWFEEQESICSDESLRRKDFDQVEEMRGSFRKLEVD